MKKSFVKEKNVHQQIVDYLKYQYPKILFRTDFAAGIKMTIGQAVKHKNLQNGKDWPDIFIAFPQGMRHGLFIELKKGKEEVYNKDGSMKKDKHIRGQYEVLCKLTGLGYVAVWGFGFEDAKFLIDCYLKTIVNEP